MSGNLGMVWREFTVSPYLLGMRLGLILIIVLSFIRSVRKAPRAKENARKKQKSSPKEGKHIPIDAFFIKSQKNL